MKQPPKKMGRLLSNQESSPLERSKFSLKEFKEADEAYIHYHEDGKMKKGWVEIEDVTMTDKGRVILYEDNHPFQSSKFLDDVKRLR